MTITTADALEVMSCVAACHPRTAPRWHDDPDSARFTAKTWAAMFNRHSLILDDLLAAVTQRAADTTDTAPEPGEIIQVARSIRRDRSDSAMANPDHRASRDAAIDSKVERLVSPLALEFGRMDRPALDTSRRRDTRAATPDPDRMAQARAELDALRGDES
ncbi:hypothetical protein KNT98_gp74 [Gordonia phage Frokostdame]|uniref:Uncharacterized protein n=1 Tax=Gordonia phage Frokostdame TaxID=2250320 RepID=A0A345L364_9CAUD|nr:hypothetical protein KNT98_gp74 [Gordonia phage Frokostdame]AXH49716.1 hypothetical protein SEA_FROKOSTDAME_74 [Gordonia phage Frokostdame]